MPHHHGELNFGNLYQLFQVAEHNFSDAVLRDLGRRDIVVKKAGTTKIPAGFTYFGQFLAHEITRMHVSDTFPEPQSEDPADIQQLRSPPFDMDSLYGDVNGFGKGIPHRQGKFTSKAQYRIPSGRELIFDLPRGTDGRAQIGDPRNDENFFVAQLHVVFLNLHNKLFDLHRLTKNEDESVKAARKELALLFQAVTVNDFLSRVLKRKVYDNLFASPIDEFLIDVRPGDSAEIPVEFAGAAFRFGHSMIRSNYNIGGDTPLGLERMFELTHAGKHWGDIGPNGVLANWPLQFDMRKYGGPDNFDHTLPIDTFLTDELREMHNEEIGNQDLVERNLARSRHVSVPSAQKIVDYLREQRTSYAEKMGLERVDIADPTLGNTDFRDVVRKHSLDENIPLWTYILLEPAFFKSDVNKHTYLGTLGSIINGEVIRSLLITSNTSIYSTDLSTVDSALMPYMRKYFYEQRVGWGNVDMSDLLKFVYH